MRRWWFAPVVLLAACHAPVTSVGSYDAGVRVADGRHVTHPEAAAPVDAAAPSDANGGSYMEAEDGALTTGFTRKTDPLASGGVYIVTEAGAASNDVPGSARAVYSLPVDTTATYAVWGRIHSPDVARNAFWFRMDGGAWVVWRLSTGEDWYWGSLHDGVDYGDPISFDLNAGTHQLEFANFIDGVSLDRLYFTTGMERPLGDDTPCRPPDSVRLGGVCVASCGSQGGTTCGDQVCTGRTPIPAYDCGVCCKAP
ncbi:MAG TPA: hypothetical protein VHU80_20745 [Polyangiaceae bacterium]|nr:hypothetical protein [Polyangiaceae bacterium]